MSVKFLKKNRGMDEVDGEEKKEGGITKNEKDQVGREEQVVGNADGDMTYASPTKSER